MDDRTREDFSRYLALEEKDFKKHSAVGSYFRHNYIKTGIFDVRYSDYLRDAFEARGGSDYDDFYIISKERVKQQIDHAKEFYDVVKAYIDDRLGKE